MANSMQGKLANPTLRGYSAYETACQNGFEGTEQEWLESLKGAKGEDGTSPIVSVSKSGTVTTVEITDTNGTKIITINDGENGQDGASVIVQSVSESTEDGGNNIVTFSDGKTVTVKNGTKGFKGDPGKDGASITIKSIAESTDDEGLNIVTFSDGTKLNIKNGSQGNKGDKGDGIPSGGTVGQVLTKTENGTEWTDAKGGIDDVDSIYSNTLKTKDKSIIGAINELYDLLGGANATAEDIKSIM